MHKKSSTNFDFLFPLRTPSGDEGEKWSKQLSVAITGDALDPLAVWNLVIGRNELRKKPDFFGFISLIRLVEAIILYDSVVIIGMFPNQDVILKPLIESGIVKGKPSLSLGWCPIRRTWQGDLVSKANIVGNHPISIDDIELIKQAKSLFPTKFKDFYHGPRDSLYTTFIGDITAVAIADELELPLIPSEESIVDCSLIRKALQLARVRNAMDMIYGDTVHEALESLRCIIDSQGMEGVLISPIILKWLRKVNEKSIETYDDMIDIALSIRNQFSNTRRYIQDLSFALCDPGGTFASYRKAQEEIKKIKKALSELVIPDGERIFILRIPDIRVLVPSIRDLLDISDPTSILEELAGKQISWWARRIKYQRIFHLFAMFDYFFNSKNVKMEISKFFGSELHQSHINWARRRDYELKNIEKYPPLNDDTEFSMEVSREYFLDWYPGNREKKT